MPDALMGAFVSSGKDFLSSLRKTKLSSSIQLGKGEVDMATDDEGPSEGGASGAADMAMNDGGPSEGGASGAADMAMPY